MPKFLLLLMMFLQPHEMPMAETDSTFLRALDPRVSKGAKRAYNSSVIIYSILDNGMPAVGSGNYFKIRNHRFIVTAFHVVDGAKRISIIERSGDVVFGKVVLVDEQRDFAVLKINENLTYTEPVRYSIDETTLIGQPIYHCGHPNEVFFNLSQGVVTNKEDDFYITNANAWPGSSGSVVFSENGRVLGVISAVNVDAPYGLPQIIPYLVRIGIMRDLSSDKIVEALVSSED
jgi:S1-C subfamily serine protease